MKILYLVFMKLKSMVCENKFIMFFFCLGVFVCNIMFIYAYGNFKTAAYQSIHEQYTIVNDKRNALDIDKVENELADCAFRIQYSIVLDKKMFAGNDSDSLDIENYFSDPKNQGNTNAFTLTAYKGIEKILLDSGAPANLLSKNTIAVPKELLKEHDGFPNIKINDIEYKIIGTSFDSFRVSLETFKENNITPDVIEIKVDGSNQGEKKERLEAKIKALFPDFTIKAPNIEDSANDLLGQSVLLTSLIYVFCLFSLLYFMAYLFDESAYELSVYELIGAKRSKVVTVLCSVQFALFMFISALALLVHKLLYADIFLKINMIDHVFYTASDYLICFALTVALALLFVIVYILIRMRKSLIANSRKFIS